MKRLIRSAWLTFVVLWASWFAVAMIVFGLRHPWATDTERLLHIGDALLFRSVTPDEVRSP